MLKILKKTPSGSDLNKKKNINTSTVNLLRGGHVGKQQKLVICTLT